MFSFNSYYNNLAEYSSNTFNKKFYFLQELESAVIEQDDLGTTLTHVELFFSRLFFYFNFHICNSTRHKI